MKKYLKKTVVIILAVACAFSIHITVSALNEVTRASIGGNTDLWSLISSIITPPTTTDPVTPPSESTTEDPNNNTTKDPVINSGTGSITTEPSTAYVDPNQNTNTTAAPPVGESTTLAPEESSPPFEASLTDLFGSDTAAVIVNPPTDQYTIGAGLAIDNGNKEPTVPWQTIALIVAAALFIILAALIIALIAQRGKDDDRPHKHSGSDTSSNSETSTPVIPEIMTPERIAELIGAGVRSGRSSTDMSAMSSEESAAAIKTAILMGQLTQSYSDPLIKKYTDEPVIFSAKDSLNLDADNMSGSDILKATDSMLDDITGNEKYAADVSGVKLSGDEIEAVLASDADGKVCPECGSAVPDDDVFCHECGAYVG